MGLCRTLMLALIVTARFLFQTCFQLETIQTACLTDSGNHALLSQEKHDTELFNNINFHILYATQITKDIF